MATTVKARPNVPRAAAAARPSPRAPARVAGHTGSTLTTDAISARQLMLLIGEGMLVGCAVLAVLLAVWYFFGDRLHALVVPSVGVPGAAGTTGASPTTYYRDRGDGTVMVLEIDGNGTRIKGTVRRTDVPLIKEDQVPAHSWGDGPVSPQSRVNALGSSFR